MGLIQIPARGSSTSSAGEGHITILPTSYKSQVQGTWAPYADSSGILNLYLGNNASGNDGDAVDFYVYMAAGTYTLVEYGIKTSNKGKGTWSIDGTDVATHDFYAAAPSYSERMSTTGITVATSGLKVCKLRINGKNAASSGYTYAQHYHVWFRTA